MMSVTWDVILVYWYVQGKRKLAGLDHENPRKKNATMMMWSKTCTRRMKVKCQRRENL